ncbi:hypothetical protein PCANC_26185 [Puccinia coronata f. sp. avenae]|uniref:Uncharacterized protein n=1 Tax=Puccinia coronata f. sp. avenae TaxID=200324 RepID=A0A2N5TJU1_9BASI|nr:hypothetical protein PCANC_26185 [Puccinia coronata f. sp. avenae]
MGFHSSSEKDLLLEGLPIATYHNKLSHHALSMKQGERKQSPPPQLENNSSPSLYKSTRALKDTSNCLLSNSLSLDHLARAYSSPQPSFNSAVRTTLPATTTTTTAVSCQRADGATTRPTTVLQVGTALTEQKNHQMESYYHH